MLLQTRHKKLNKSASCLPNFVGFLICIFCNLTYGICPEEAENARENSFKISQEWPLRPSNDRVTQYVQKLGGQLIAQGRNSSRWMPNYDGDVPYWKFWVVRDLSVNAFSIGNGWIYITDGSIAFAKSETDLAAMLSHEIGHQIAGHFCKKTDLNNFNILFDIFSIHETQKNQYTFGSMSLMIDTVKEQEADQIAFSILKEKNYDPNALLDIARRLPSHANSQSLVNHRIQFLEAISANSPRQPDKNIEEFHNIKLIVNNHR